MVASQQFFFLFHICSDVFKSDSTGGFSVGFFQVSKATCGPWGW